MKLTGIEAPFATLLKPEPNSMYVVVSDEKGETRVIKVDNGSLAENEAVLRVTGSDKAFSKGGCFVASGGTILWKNPCPF